MKRIAGAVLAAPVLGVSLLAAGTIPAVTAEAASTGVTVTVVRGALNAPKHLTVTPAGLYLTQLAPGSRAHRCRQLRDGSSQRGARIWSNTAWA